MSSTQKPEAVFRPDDNEHLGFVVSVGGAWQAQTIFGYDFATLATRDDAVREVMKNGLQILTKSGNIMIRPTVSGIRAF